MKTYFASTVVRGSASALMVLGMIAGTASAHAGSISVPSLSTTSSFEFGTNGNLTGWTNGNDGHGNNAYNFNFQSVSVAKGAGAADEYGSGHVILDSATVADPNCSSCAFLGLDSDYHTGPISASITGLTVGATETVTFDFAGTQQTGYNGYSTDFIDVMFGGVTKQSANTANVPTQGFSGWQTASFTFTANATSETLSFLAGGTQQYPGGNEPTFALVDNIAISQSVPSPTPEPSSLMLLSTGLLGMGGLVRMRISKLAAAAK